MGKLPEDTAPFSSECPRCGEQILPQHTVCPACGHDLMPPDPSPTNALLRRPQVWPQTSHGSRTLLPHSQVILQFFPSGTCLVLGLDRPVTLGRTLPPGSADVIDLTELNAAQHGVSRHHCLLERRDQRLLLTDLDSTNGTTVNGERILPHHEITLAHGDRLTLGTLHVLVTFS